MQTKQRSCANLPIDDKAATIIIRKSSDPLKSIRRDIDLFIDESEEIMARFKASDDFSIDEFKKSLQESAAYLNHLTDKIHQVDDKMRNSFDATRIRIHLETLDAKDARTSLRERLGRFKAELDSLLMRSERSLSQRISLLSAETLKLMEAIESRDSCRNMTALHSWPDRMISKYSNSEHPCC